MGSALACGGSDSKVSELPQTVEESTTAFENDQEEVTPESDTSTQNESPEAEETEVKEIEVEQAPETKETLEDTYDAEAEARQWIIDYRAEVVESDFEALEIRSVTAEEWVEICYLKTGELSPRWGDSDFWQQTKANALNPNYESPISAEDYYRLLIECSADLFTPQELVRSGLIEAAAEAAAASADDSSTQDASPEVGQALEPTPTPESSITVSQQQAVRSADSYLSYSSFSRSGLIDQLEYEGFSTADATYGVDAQNADWDAQAVGSAQDYLDYSSFSRSGLIDQLIYEGFTLEQATYGVDAQNADWNAQAAGSAQDYLNYSSFSRSGLIDQLIYEGFTLQQATYGVNAVGL